MSGGGGVASGGMSTERAGVLRYSTSTGMEKIMEESPAAITGSMLLRSWSRMNALSVYSSLETNSSISSLITERGDATSQPEVT